MLTFLLQLVQEILLTQAGSVCPLQVPVGLWPSQLTPPQPVARHAANPLQLPCVCGALSSTRMPKP